MKHALVGAGEYLPRMEPVDLALIDKLGKPAKVVCIPAGAGTEGPSRIRYWSEMGVNHFTKLGVEAKAVEVIDRTTADDPNLAEQIAEANFVYFSGGKPSYLFDTLNGSLAWQAVETVLQNGGLLAGCSAGAMIQGSQIAGRLKQSGGFGLLPNSVILPHFDEYPGFVSRASRLISGTDIVTYGIDGMTALYRDGDKLEVIGSGGVTVITKAGKTRYTAGPIPSNQ
ncbi:MAG: Type 1 glutamine amidotransferase-like domain-containing protein [Anaerolineae bacterium]